MDHSHHSIGTRGIRLISVLIVFLSSLVLLARPPVVLAAADIVVNSDADVEADDGACTLREAIEAANSNIASGALPGECAAGSADGPDIITFDDDYTITVGSTLPTVSSPMTITGNDPNNTIIQASACNPVDPQPPDCTPAGHRVFFIVSSGDLTLERLTVRHGHAANSTAGGGIANSGGQLTVTGSAFSGNVAGGHAGAIYSSGGLDVTDSTFSGNWADGNGGAIFGPDLQVTDSAFFGNTADSNGGAIYSTWDLMVTGSTFSGNEGTAGGAIALEGTEHTITNSTFSGNIASAVGGAIWNAEDTAATTVVNSTFYDNEAPYGSTIFRSDGTLTLSNSISADQNENDEPNCDGGITDGGGNFSDHDSCPGAAIAPSDLLPLADNGGPTLTHALAPGSPAIGAIDANIPETDQRGVARPTENADAGAYQTSVCGDSPFAVSNDAELTEAINCINQAGDPIETINIENDFTVYTLDGTYQGTPPLTNVNTQVIINGNDHTLTGDGNGRFFTLQGGTGKFDKITLTGGSANEGGAIWLEYAELNAISSTFSDNWGRFGGGAIYLNFGHAAVSNSTFIGNKTNLGAGQPGGAIQTLFSSSLIVNNSTFSENHANIGGAISSLGSTTVFNSTFYGNVSVQSGGGAAYMGSGDFDIINSLFVNNGDVACSPNLVAFGSNIIDTENGCDEATFFTAAEINLQPLDDNGGPTQTHALLPGSPAVNHVKTGYPAIDQRGVTRPQGTAADAGAFEVNTAQLTIAKTTDPAGGEGFPFTIDPIGNQPLSILGELGLWAGQFKQPTGVALDAAGNVYVADFNNHRIQKFDANGSFLLTFGRGVDGSNPGTGFEVCTVAANCQAGGAGGGAGQFDSPYDVIVDADGNIYVADANNHRVQKFDSEGNFLLAFGRGVNGGTGFEVCTVAANCQAGSQGPGGGQLGFPTGIAVDAGDNVYVTDNLNNRIQKFADDGSFLLAFGWDVDGGNPGDDFEVCTVAANCQAGAWGGWGGQFSYPTGVTLDAGGNIYVADSINHRVQKFNAAGEFLLAFGWGVNGGTGSEVCTVAANCQAGAPGDGAGQLYNPEDVVEDTDGNIIVADHINNRIQKFDANGAFLLAFGGNVVAGNSETGFEVCRPGDTCQTGESGNAPGQINNPYGVAVDAAGAIYVADTFNHRIQVFAPDTAFTLDDGQSEVFTLMPGSYQINELVPDGWELESIDCNGGDPDYLGATATVTLDVLDDVTCTFHNVETAPPAEPCPDVDGNLITNFCFEDGSAPWAFYSDGHGTYNVTSAAPYMGVGVAEIGITEPGSNVQFYQSGIQLKAGTGYELSFVARSNNEQDLSVYLHQHGAPYANYGLSNYQANLTTAWQTFTVSFTTPNNIGNVSDGRLRFWLAPYSTTGDVYFIDRVVLRETADAPPVEPPPPPPPPPELGHCDSPVPGNVLLNPGFEAQKNSWKFANDGVMTFTTPAKPNTTPFECQRNARIQITTQGNSVQLYQTGFTLLPDTDYYLRFAGRSSNGRNASLFLHQHSAPYTNYGLNGTVVDLTTSWQVFELHFKTNATFSETADTRLRFWLSPFDADGMTYEFDDVVLMPQAADPVRAANATEVTSATSLVSGYYIDAAHPDRLAGGYVGEVAGCRAARVGLSRLWPANNKMKAVTITNVGTPQTLDILGVWQDEPVGPEPDAVIGADGVVYLRAERDLDAGADGRVYTIQFRAAYANGQSCDYVATVGVPLTNGRGMEAVNGGGLFGSLTE